MRILFFHQGRIADWAGAVLGGLSQQFPSAEILRFDLHELVKERRPLLAKNLLVALADYGWDLACQRRDLDDAFFTTGYLFNEVKKLSQGIHARHPADFSFQMHSMHDHSAPGTPHFVYTDFTYKSGRQLPSYGHHKWAPPRSEKLITLERTIYGNAACAFVQSQFVATTLAREYGMPASKVLNVRYGPNIDRATLLGIPITKERFKTKTVLFVGGEWERKGGPELLRAFTKVHRVHPEAKLLVIGCQPNERAEFMEVIGKIPLSQLANYYRQAAVFCMPSQREPSASVYVEAMYAGLPVVALKLGAVCELVADNHTGFLVHPGDVETLADKLIELLGDPETCCRLGANSRETVAADYSWDRVFHVVGERIRKCLALDQAPPASKRFTESNFV
jgi:glycosyltransferase involved in cell wall biosynthesis